jgi:large subunit ribosomal protein L4
MEINNISSKKTLSVSDDIFAKDFNEALVHQVLTAYMAAARAGTKAQKTRAEVRGGGAKPWRQKGTGRARAGTIRSPIWRKGGVIFAATPRSYKQKVNRKMYRGALCSILSELNRQNRLLLINDLEIADRKTKSFIKLLESLSVQAGEAILVITDSLSENVYLAARNLPNIYLTDSTTAIADPVAFVRADKVIVTEAALKEIEGKLQ